MTVSFRGLKQAGLYLLHQAIGVALDVNGCGMMEDAARMAVAMAGSPKISFH